jgi:hypothetical protein
VFNADMAEHLQEAAQQRVAVEGKGLRPSATATS